MGEYSFDFSYPGFKNVFHKLIHDGAN